MAPRWPPTLPRLPGMTYRTRSVLVNLTHGGTVRCYRGTSGRRVFDLVRPPFSMMNNTWKAKRRIQRIQRSIIEKLIDAGYLRPASIREEEISGRDVTPAGHEALALSDGWGRKIVAPDKPLPPIAQALEVGKR